MTSLKHLTLALVFSVYASGAYSVSNADLLERLNALEFEMQMREIDRENDRLLRELLKQRQLQRELNQSLPIPSPKDSRFTLCEDSPTFLILGSTNDLCIHIALQTVAHTSPGITSYLTYEKSLTRIDTPLSHHRRMQFIEIDCSKNNFRTGATTYYSQEGHFLKQVDSNDRWTWKKIPQGSYVARARLSICK